MKNIKTILFTTLIFFCTVPVFAQSFYRPWSSYKPVKPQYPYKTIDTLTPKFRIVKCIYRESSYEPNQIITNLDINKEETFNFFKDCCAKHPSRCVSDYIGTNNQTLLYTLVEYRAYRYMQWILNEGFVYDSNIDNWGIYNEVNGLMVPVRNYTPMMLACKRGDLTAVKILRERGSYLSTPENAVGLTPYEFAKRDTLYKNTQFLQYIENEYNEEIKNINQKKSFGKDFDAYIIQDFIDFLDKNFLEYQRLVIEKAYSLNKI